MGMIFFFFFNLILNQSRSGLAWNEAIIMFFNFLNFFLFFFGILHFESGTNWLEREFFFSLFLCYYRPILGWKEAIMMIFNFLNFFPLFFEFPIPGRVGIDRNNNFFFSHSQPVPSRFGLKRSHNDVFINFLFFLLFFWNSIFRVGLEWIGTITFFLYHSQPVPYRFGFNWSQTEVF